MVYKTNVKLANPLFMVIYMGKCRKAWCPGPTSKFY